MEQTNAPATVAIEAEQLRQRLHLLENKLEEFARRDAEYEQFLDRAGIAIQRVDPDGTIVWASRGQLDLLGYSRDEYFGRKLADFCEFPVDAVPQRESATAVRCKDGTIRHVVITSTTLLRGTGQGYDTLVMRDITERRRSELRLAVQFGVSQLLTRYSTIAEAAPAVLKLICEYLEFECGVLWAPDGSEKLRCEAVWQRERPELTSFIAETQSRTFRRGVGLPGRVQAQCAPAWIETLHADDNFPRRPFAIAAGLHCGVAFPIRAGDECLGVIEFFSADPRKPDVQLLDALDTLGLHIGQFIKRREAEFGSEIRAKHLQVLFEMADSVIRAVSVQEIYNQALLALERLVGVERSSILLFDSDGVMRFKHWHGISDEYRRAVEGHSPWSPDEKSPEPVLVHDVNQDPRLKEYAPVFKRENIAALAFIPLVSRGRLIGKFMLYSATPHPLAHTDIALARTIASHVAVAIERKEAEAALNEQQTRLELALDAAQTGVWEWDIVANRLIWSDRVYEIHGLPSGSMSGVPLDASALFHPDDRDRVRDAVLEAVRTRGSYAIEFRILRPGGELRWIATSGRVVCDEENQPVRLIGTTVDITERKLAEDTLRQSSDTINALLESAAQAILSVDEQGHVITVNQMAERMFGHSRDELMGQNLEVLMPDRLRRAHIVHRASFNENPRARPMGAGLELTALRRDGTEFPVEISLSFIRTRNGLLSVAFVTDISARKQAEQALRESEERYRTLFEHSNDALGVSADEKFAYVNPAFARIFGYSSPDELVGVSIYDNVAPSEREKIRRNRQQRQQAGSLQPIIYAGLGLRQDGTEFVSEIRATDYWMNGKLHTLVILRDITADRQAEDALTAQAAALARSNADLQQFAYATSHDLQEPLRNIAAYSQLLARKYTGKLDAEADQFIGNIVSGCQRMEALIRDLLAFSRVGSAETAMFSPVDMSAALAWAQKNLEFSIGETGAEVTSGDLPAVLCDQVQLVQLLQNLLGNALKYRRGPPRIHVSASLNGKEWTFAVQDNGIGIAPEYHDRIFGLFKRLHGRAIPGTGVGLSICKRIVEKHGGRIWVESAPNAGSTFFFTLPALS